MATPNLDDFAQFGAAVNCFSASTRDCKALDHYSGTAPVTSKRIWRSAPGSLIAARAVMDGREAPPVLAVTL